MENKRLVFSGTAAELRRLLMLNRAYQIGNRWNTRILKKSNALNTVIQEQIKNELRPDKKDDAKNG